MSADVLPAPLVKPTRHPARFAGQRLVALTWGGILTYFGVLAVAAFYYLLFEKVGWVHSNWHQAVPNSDLRHNIRDVAEGLFGGLLSKQFIWDHYKATKRKPGLFDKFFMKVHWPTPYDDRELKWYQGFPILQVLVLLFALPGFYLMWRASIAISDIVATHHGAIAALNFHDSGSTAIHHHLNTIQKMEDTVTHNWPKRLIGFGAAFFWGERPARGVFDDIQLAVARYMYVNGYKCPRILPAAFKARYNSLAVGGLVQARAQERSNRGFLIALGIFTAIVVALIIYGWYVMTYIAPH